MCELQILEEFPALRSLLNTFIYELEIHIPEQTSSYLFGGITLGDFSPSWSDVDIIVWVDTPYVSNEMIERSFRLWTTLAELPHGSQVYMYVAPCRVIGGPMNPAGGGTAGEPQSLRVYRNKWREMSGYPLSLPDTVCLSRHGVVLTGQDVRHELPAVPDNWAERYLVIQLSALIRAVNQKNGPFGDNPRDAVEKWGPEGIMSYPIWFARHLYSLTHLGEVTSKERALKWYIENHNDALRVTLETILRWREQGAVAHAGEVEQVAVFTKQATVDFLRHVSVLKGIPYEGLLTDDLSAALQFVSESI